MSRVEKINRKDIRNILNGERLRGGHMLIAVWKRATDKFSKVDGVRTLVEPAGTLISRRVILRNDWSKATPSGNYTPKGGNAFNAESKEKAREIMKESNLFLAMSLEGKTHPHGEKDHPVAIPLDQLIEIKDTHADIVYRIED